MFESVHIENFRAVKSADIENLKQINVFFGKNNCGKTSILEAIFLLSGISNPLLPLNINAMRGYTGVTEKDMLLDFHNLTTDDIVISCQAESNRSLHIRQFKSTAKDVSIEDLKSGSSEAASHFHGLSMEYFVGNSATTYKSNVVIPSDTHVKKFRIKKDERYQEKSYAEYIPANYMQISMLKKYAQIITQKQNQAIVDVLRVIEPSIKNIQLVGDKVMVDTGLSQLLPINMLGDGIRKIFSIIVTICCCKGGMLFVDEVDNGFHFSAMKTLWTAILSMAEANDVQMFITSHNIDSLKGLLQAYAEHSDKQDHLSVYKIIKKSDASIVPLRYDYAKVQYMVEQEMELR